jgi:hypothetical protein
MQAASTFFELMTVGSAVLGVLPDEKCAVWPTKAFPNRSPGALTWWGLPCHEDFCFVRLIRTPTITTGAHPRPGPGTEKGVRLINIASRLSILFCKTALRDLYLLYFRDTPTH